MNSIESVKSVKEERILLVMLPYWTPLIPPQGIASIKVYLEKHGYSVRTADANIEEVFKEIYEDYFNALKRFVPEDQWGNFYNIGHDVLRNQMMAYFNHTPEHREEYSQLVKIIIYNTFLYNLSSHQIDVLNTILERYYNELEIYMLDLLNQEKPAVVGLSTNLGTLASCLFGFRLIKKHNPDILTVAGGTVFSGELPIGSPDFDYFMDNTPYIDNVLVGEGQQLLLKLLEGELPVSRRLVTLEDVGGKTLDTADLDLPDLSDFPLQRYPYMANGTSFSCPHNCRFCNVRGFFGEYRAKSIRQIMNEFRELYRRHRCQLYFMTDALLNPLITELSGELAKSELSVYMDGYLRVSGEVCDRDKTLLWRRGGLYRTRLGIETGSPRLLEMMDKNITLEESRESLASLAEAGIKTTAYFVVGFPGETEEDFQQTLDYLEEMKNNIWQAECNPFYYYFVGQPNSDKWSAYRKLLYPESARKLLMTQTWIVDCEPSREERFRRIFRFEEHRKKLGIPNPYSYQEINRADERWQNLHENSVPPLIAFENKDVFIDDAETVKQFTPAEAVVDGSGDFVF